MNEDTKPFLSEGLTVYSEARATLTFFEQEIIKLLSNAIDRRGQWLPLKNHRVKWIEADRSLGQAGYWVEIIIEGLSQREEAS